MNSLKIDKPIRLIELFAGVGSQAKALKRLNADFEHYKISEWEVNATASYKAIHQENNNTDYSAKFTAEQLSEVLFNIGISTDGKKPMTLKEISRKGEQWKRTVYNNFKATNNVGSILNISGTDLGIFNTDKYCYIMTYSFPCQDLSLAGKGKGMAKGANTRSGLLWEVERLLNECEELPQVLLMENVTQVHGTKNKEHFDEWIRFLESKGYSNYWEDLNAKNFGIPQNRNRTFMVSVLGDYTYEFPKEFPLELRLKDMLEDSVDEKFYLSDIAIQGRLQSNFRQYNLERSLINKKEIHPTILARYEGSPTLLQEPQVIGGIGEKKSNGGTQWYQQDRIYDDNVAISVTTTCNPYYATAMRGRTNENGEIEQNIEVSDREYANAITTVQKDSMVAEPCINVVGNYSPSGHDASRIVDADGLAPTVKENHGTVTAVTEPQIVEDFYKNRDERVYEGIAPTLRSERTGLKVVEPIINKIDIPQIVRVRKYEVDCTKLSEVLRSCKRSSSLTNQDIAKHLNVPLTKIEHWFRQDKCFAIPDENIWFDLKALLGIETDEFDESIMTFEEKEGVFEKSNRCYFSNGLAPTITSASADEKVIEPQIIREEPLEREGWHDHAKEVLSTKGVCRTLCAQSNNLVTKIKELYTSRIRKLTPKECWRLMGFDDADFEKAAAVNSNSQLYKQAGNSIVVNVLCYIFEMML